MDEVKKDFRTQLDALRMQEYLYRLEHKKENPEIVSLIKELKQTYARELYEQKYENVEGEGKNVKR